MLSAPQIIFGPNVIRFELDYALAALPKPYVTIMDGITSKRQALRVTLARADMRFLSGGRCGPLRRRSIPHSDGEYEVCYAGNEYRILS
jgi:hypothetical protein